MPASLETKTPAVDALASLRALVLPDVALQEALGDIEDFQVFADRPPKRPGREASTWTPRR
jgi:hypothetical protein